MTAGFIVVLGLDDPTSADSPTLVKGGGGDAIGGSRCESIVLSAPSFVNWEVNLLNQKIPIAITVIATTSTHAVGMFASAPDINQIDERHPRIERKE
ncbi:hypothetical protein ASPFODRAFT_45179 [Aspergillus luchuensis CBS 106.47]|uniref:Uncharacterized protein n=1 Tax=Aspergillus luchuensis (strain CBS 106.47) TaxID=1137211 RepID=A0A1M3TLH2_ASPLC|nr:hypothetical protein ASPFODRAFT_45179 [Aspergillus luchuensis CBS 106.47]